MGRTNTAGVKGCAWQAHPVLSFFIIFLLVVYMFPIRESAHAQTDVSDQIQINYANPLYDRRARVTSYDVTLTNTGGVSISAPIKVIIEGISSDQVSVANPDGTTTDGKPYFDYSDFLGDGALDSQETSQAKKWKFNNPTRTRFTVQTLVLGGEEEYGPPCITITNPVDDGIIADATPFITILFNDTDSGIDTNSFEIEINGVNSTSLFDVTGTGASCQYDAGLPQGINVISATISNNHGISNSASATFNVATSAEENLYVFSLEENPWLFASPGDGTYAEYLSPQDLGVDGTDVTSLAMSGSGNHYFTQLGGSQILESMGGGTNSLYLTYVQLGLVDLELDALYLTLNGSVIFSLLNQQDIFYSAGDNSNSLFITNNDLGVLDKEITGLHIGYDGLIYFAVPSDASEDGVAIYQSAGNGNSSLFLTSGDLGVPGSEIDAFAMVPDTDAPSIAITSPTEGAFLNTTTPAITVVFSDDYAGIDTSSFNMAINGIDYTDQCTVTGTGANCQVTNDLPVGSNTAVATISDLAGNQASDSSTFQIGVIRAIPGATPISGPSPLTVHFTTDGEDPAGTIEVFRWDFDGDGSWDTYDTVANDYDRTYNNSGTYTVTLFVQSSTGETATETVTIVVENNPPIATAEAVPSNGAVPLTVQLQGSGTDVDGSIVLYEWDFDGDGVFDWSSTTTGNTSYTYTAVGDYNAIFRVTDNEGASATATAITTVISAGPEGSPTAQGTATPTSGLAPLTVSFDGTGTDPDGTIVLYEWDFEHDGVFDWSSATTASTTHTYNDAGTVAVAFRVTDNDGSTGVDYLVIEVGLQVSLEVSDSDQTFNPYLGESIAINASINAPVPAFVDIKNEEGAVVKSISVDTTNVPVPLFTDSMENGAGGWTHGGSNDRWQLGAPTYGPGSARSGNNAWGTNLSGYYSNNMNSWLLTPFIQITEATELTFYHYFNCESYYDGGIVEVTTDGTNFTRIVPNGGYPYNNFRFGGNAYSGSLGGWSEQTFSLSNYIGQTVQIRFRFLTDGSVIGQGWYIDDVKIQTATGNVIWDGTDNNNLPANDGVYYAVLRYQYQNAWHEFDLSNSTGGTRFVPPRQSTGGSYYNPALSRPFEDQFLPIHFTLNRASEVTLFVGVLQTNLRVKTIYNRLPMPAGSHTAYWDGLDDGENLAQAPPGQSLILGIWGYTLADNAMFMTGGKPEVSQLAAEPNYYSPFSEKCDSQGNGEGVLLTYDVSENVSSVELRVYSLETGNLIRSAFQLNVPAGDNTFFWDGKNNNGEYPDIGDYQVGLIARDAEGNESMLNYTLVRIDY